MKKIERKWLALLLSIVFIMTLLCVSPQNPFINADNVDIVISVPDKNNKFGYCVNEEVPFDVTVKFPHLVEKIIVNYGENSGGEEIKITTNQSINKQIILKYIYKKKGAKTVSFTIKIRGSDETKIKQHLINIGVEPRFKNDGKLVSTGEIETGKRLILSTEHEGPGETTFEWYKNNTLLPTQKNSSLIFNPLTESDTGEYYCIVKTIWGEQRSKVFTLSYENNLNPPEILFHPQSIQVTPGNSAKFYYFH